MLGLVWKFSPCGGKTDVGMREQDSNAMPDVLSELRGLSNLTPEGSDD